VAVRERAAFLASIVQAADYRCALGRGHSKIAGRRRVFSAWPLFP